MPLSNRIKQINWLGLIPLAVTLFVFGGLLLSYLLIPQARQFTHKAWFVLTSEDRELIENWVSRFGVWGIAVMMLLFLLQMFAFVLPSWFLIIVSVLAYGPVGGGLVALAGISFAATVAYIIGRLFSRVTIQKMIGEQSERKMRFLLDRYGFWLVVIFRLAPFLSLDVISFVAGLTEMSYRRFMVATVLGISPLIVLIAILGETNERLFNGLIVATVVSIVGFVFYVWWDRKQ
ncbi:MAG: TVP38/TMEM64 family protein, partial [Chitinispirillaceae bacterium]